MTLNEIADDPKKFFIKNIENLFNNQMASPGGLPAWFHEAESEVLKAFLREGAWVTPHVHRQNGWELWDDSGELYPLACRHGKKLVVGYYFLTNKPPIIDRVPIKIGQSNGQKKYGIDPFFFPALRDYKTGLMHCHDEIMHHTAETIINAIQCAEHIAIQRSVTIKMSSEELFWIWARNFLPFQGISFVGKERFKPKRWVLDHIRKAALHCIARG